MPDFGNSWLYGFQKRHGIKYREHHRGMASEYIVAEESMVAIREYLADISPNNIYNCDETGLFWKLVPDRSLSTRNLPGRKPEKARISALFCCNADGSDKLPIWFVGSAAKPRAFSAAGVHPAHLNMYWRSNHSARMTTPIFEEFLRWFDKRMTGRKVVLLMDNFSAHENALRIIEASGQPLQNTRVIWLPPNSTSKFQPLDQGIIWSWKANWRRNWVRFISREVTEKRNPMATMNVVTAVRWGIEAWDLGVTPETIKTCFHKALQGSSMDTGLESIEPEIRQELQVLEEAHIITDPMDVSQFLEPSEEKVEDIDEQVVARIIARFEPEQEESDQEEEEEEEVVVPCVTAAQALLALQQLRTYEEQTGGDTEMILRLTRRERDIRLASNRA